MDPNVPAMAGLLTMGGLAIGVTVVVEVILRAWRPSPQVHHRMGIVLAYVVGLAASAIAVWLWGGDVWVALALAVLLAWSSMGLHDTASMLARA